MAYGKRYTVLAPAGHTFVSDPERGLMIETDTVQCVHCGRHWSVDPKTARGRGFCTRCNGPICGRQCAECIPIEKRLEMMEVGRV